MYLEMTQGSCKSSSSRLSMILMPLPWLPLEGLAIQEFRLGWDLTSAL